MSDWAELNWEEIVGLPLLAKAQVDCAVVGCGREKRAKGLCNSHYLMARMKFDPEYRERRLEGMSRAGRRLRERRRLAEAYALLGFVAEGIKPLENSRSLMERMTTREYWEEAMAADAQRDAGGGPPDPETGQVGTGTQPGRSGSRSGSEKPK